MASKEIAQISDYAVMSHDVQNLKEIIAEAAGPGGLSPNDLDRVKVPTGGATSWQVPDLEGEVSCKELTGIILYHQDVRAYWRVSYDEGGGDTPPDCASMDGLTGHGDPGGRCSTCPLSQWGSASKGKGQACKQLKLLYLLQPEAVLPIVVSLPPTSVKTVKQYLLRLASRAKKPQSIVTVLTLEKTKNAEGIPYSMAKPAMLGYADPELENRANALAEALKSVLSDVTLTASDVE